MSNKAVDDLDRILSEIPTGEPPIESILGRGKTMHRRRRVAAIGFGCVALAVAAGFASNKTHLGGHQAPPVATPGPTTPTGPTRWVGAQRVALAVPSSWKTEVQRDSLCPTSDPQTVQFFAFRHGPSAPCGVPIGGSWPALDSVSIYTHSEGVDPTPNDPPSGTVGGLSYYIADSRQTGPGVAMTLTVPEAGVQFLVGAANPDAAHALLATVRYVPAGTSLR
jgi:hypothetical protein